MTDLSKGSKLFKHFHFKLNTFIYVLFTLTVLVSSSFGFYSAINNSFEREAIAGINYICPDGTLSGVNCITPKVPVNVTRCPNGTLPSLAGGLCDGYSQNYLWRCDINTPGQVQVYATENHTVCTYSGNQSNFWTGTCRWNEGDLPDGSEVFDGQNPDNRTNRFNEMLRYTNPLRSQYACQSSSAGTSSGCPLSSMRIISGGAAVNYGTSYPTVNVLCATITALGATGANNSMIIGSPLFSTATGFNDSSNHNKNQNCGASAVPGYTTIITDNNAGDENIKICGLLSFAPQTVFSELQCPASFAPLDATNCTKSAIVSSYTVDELSIGNGSCVPTSLFGDGSLFDCTFPLSGSPNNVYVLPAGGMKAGYWKTNIPLDWPTSRESNFCTIVNSNLICNGVPAENVTGSSINANIYVHQVGVFVKQNLTSVEIKSATCTNGATNFSACNVCPANMLLYNGNCLEIIPQPNISSLSVVCNGGVAVYINSTTSCLISLTGNKVIPPTFQIGIGDGNLATSSCAMNLSPLNTATCTGVSTGTIIGQQNIFGRLNTSSTTANTNSNAIVQRYATENDWGLFCTPEVRLINELVNCSGQLAANTVDSNIKVKVGNSGAEVLCTINQTGAILCSNVSVGSTTGSINIFAKSDNVAEFKQIDNVTVNRLATAVDYNLICSPTLRMVNETVVCNGTIPNFVVDSNVTVKVGASGIEANCTIAGLNVSCQAANVGPNIGVQNILLNSNSVINKTTGTVTIKRFATNLDYASLSCTPDIRFINESVNCSGQLPNNVIDSNIMVQVTNSGNYVSCTFVEPSITCQNVNVGNVIGVQDIFVKSDKVTNYKFDTVTVNRNANSGDINLSCTPDVLYINQTINCTGTKSSLNVVVQNGKVKVSNTGAYANCTINALVITCNNVNVGGNIGVQDVFFKSDELALDYKIDTVRVLKIADPSDLTSLTCTPETQKINNNITCSGSITNFKTLTNLKVKVDTNGTYGNCTVNYTTLQVNCNAVNVGSNTGIKQIYYKFDELVADYNFDTVTVVRDATNNDLFLSCDPEVMIVGQKVNCYGFVPPNVTLTNLQVKVGSSGIYSNCSISATRQISCLNVEAGEVLGVNNIFVKSLEVPTDSQIDSILIRTNASPTDINISCNPDVVSINAVVICSGSILPNKVVTNLKISNGSFIANCAVNYTTLVISCEPINVGSTIGNINIYGKYDEEQQNLFIDDVIVQREATATELTMSCTPKITLVNTTVTCSGETPSNTIVNNLKVKMRTGTDLASCTQNLTTFRISCNPLNVGPNTGLIDVLAFETTTNTGIIGNEPESIIAYEINDTIIDKITVLRPATLDDITNINCIPNPAYINSQVNCQVMFTDSYLKFDTISIRNGKNNNVVNCQSDVNPITGLTANITCLNLDVGNQKGIANIDIKLNSDSTFTKKGELTIIETPNSANVVITCNSEVSLGGEIVCKGTIEDNVAVNKITVKILDKEVECSISNKAVTCPPVKVPSDYNANSIDVFVKYNTDGLFVKFATVNIRKTSTPALPPTIKTTPTKKVIPVPRTGEIIGAAVISTSALSLIAIYTIRLNKKSPKIRG